MLDYFYFACLMLVGQLSPGPDMLLILKNSFNHDLRAAIFTIVGIITGIVIHTTIALTGLAFVIRQDGPIYLALKYGGALYLSYLGVRLLLSLKKNHANDQPQEAVDSRQLSDASAFSQGLLTNLLNPKVVIIISSILLMFLGAESSAIERLTYGTILVIEGLIVWLIFARLLQTRHAKRQFLRWESPINATFGVLLIVLAFRAIIT